MSRANRLFLWLLGLLLLAGLLSYAYWFALNFERQSREVRSGISPQARKNPFLAAEIFLRQGGQTAQSHAGREIFTLQPGGTDTIFLGHHSSLFLQRSGERLRAWVEAGGKLVLVAERQPAEQQRPNALFEALGVELREGDDTTTAAGSCSPASSGRQGTQAGAPDSQEEEKTETVTVTFHADHPGEFHASFMADRHLYDTDGSAEVVVGRGDRAKLLGYRLGRGRVTVLSDAALFTNQLIAQHDHAYLFNQLVATPGKVWLFYSADMPSLPTLLWQRAPYLSLTMLGLLLMAGWRMLPRSGPQLRPVYEQRRNLLEHLDASAEYSWHIDRAQRLFDDNRDAIEQAWRRRHPQLNSLTQEARCEWIGEKIGISSRAVERSLYQTITTEQDFIRASAMLQRLAAAVSRRSVGGNQEQ